MAQGDPYVQKQIKHMMAFIEQEANEKADEIDSKAEEEFNLQKGQLVTDARQKINEEYEKKEKQVELYRKIQSSKNLNVARLQVLKCKQNAIETMLEEIRQKLIAVTKQPNEYRQLLEKLLLQGLLQLTEDNVVIRCCQRDTQMVQDLLPGTLQLYEKEAGKKCNAVLDTQSPLHERCGGGVELAARNGKIMVANTLEKRLEQVASQLLPQIRAQLFGPNPNRKFLD